MSPGSILMLITNIPWAVMITEGSIRASIRILKYLLIIELAPDFERFCILSPKTKEVVPIKN